MTLYFFFINLPLSFIRRKKKTQSRLPWKIEGLSCHHGIRALLFAPVFLRDGYLSSSYASAFHYLLPTMMPYKTTLYMSLSRPLLCRMFSLLFCFVLFCFLFKLRWMIIKADRATYIPSFNFQQDHTYQAKDFFFARFRQLLSMTDYMITLIPPSNVAVAPLCFSLGANRGL
jgi:hypothetical protein